MKLFDRRPICNNNPESAPLVNGKPFILCWRCCGAVVGLLLSLLAYRIFRFRFIINVAMIILLIIPACADWLFIRLYWKRGNNKVRFVTGFLLGISIGFVEMSFFIEG